MRKVVILFVMIFLLSSAVLAEWEKQDSNAEGYDLYGIEAITQHIVFAVGTKPPGSGLGSDGIILRTTDGEEWNIVHSSEEQLYAVCAFNENEILAAGESTTIFKSEDGGDTWTQTSIIANPEPGGTIDAIYCIGDKAYAVGGLSKSYSDATTVVLKSNNRGDSWAPIYLDNRGRLDGVHFLTEEIGYVVGDDKVYKTTDGTRFREINDLNILGLDFNDIYCTTANNCWAVGSSRFIFRTLDGGATDWTRIDTIQELAAFQTVYFKDGNNGWIGGQNQIKKTEDGGLTWEIDRADISDEFSGHIPTAYVRDIDFVDDVGYAAGDKTSLDDEGLILRLGEPRRIIDIEPVPVPGGPRIPSDSCVGVKCVPVMDDCEAYYCPAFGYDECGCAESYICIRDCCIAEYSSCLRRIHALVETCESTYTREGCLEEYDASYEACHEGYDECAGLTETEEEEDAGITPNSFLWGFDRVFEQVNLFFTIDKAKKIEKRLDIAKERMLETKAMIEKDKLDAAAKAKKKYDKVVDKVSEELKELEGEEKVKELGKELESYIAKLNKELTKLKAKKLSKEQEDIVKSMEVEEVKGEFKKEGELPPVATKEKAYEELQLSEKEWNTYKSKLEPYDEKYWKESYELWLGAEKDLKSARLHYEEGEWQASISDSIYVRKILLRGLDILTDNLKKAVREAEAELYETEIAERDAAWEVFRAAELEFDEVVLKKYGLGQQPWKHGEKVGNLYFETVGYLNKGYENYEKGDYAAVRDNAVSLKKAITVLVNAYFEAIKESEPEEVVEEKEPEPTKECLSYCLKGIYYFSGAYNTKTAGCEYSQKTCEYGCNDAGTACAEAPVKDCPSYCSKSIYYYDGSYNIKTTQCEYSSKACGYGCNDAGTACASAPQKY